MTIVNKGKKRASKTKWDRLAKMDIDFSDDPIWAMNSGKMQNMEFWPISACFRFDSTQM
jgi:hypothetical protein